MNLTRLQTVFTQALDPGSDDQAREEAARLLNVGGDLQPLDRLCIYQHNVSAVHQRAMERIFPVCRKILGDVAFANFCRDFSWAEPTANPDLNQYGESFPEFLAQQIEQRNELRGYEYLPDLTRLEYLWHAAYYARDDSPFDFGGFSRLQAQGANIVFDSAHSLSLMQSDYPVLEIWQQHRSGETGEAVKGITRRQYLLVYRQEFEPQIFELDLPRFALLQGCQRGESIAALAENCDAASALESLASLIDKGWITGFHHV
jgi:hypothetical protein